jgi:hypothetical protein
VFILESEESAKCGYCGEVIEDGYVKGDFNIYCSTDCRTAGRMWCWVCMLLIMLPYCVMFWFSYDNNIEILPFLITLQLMMFYIAFLAVQGFRTRRRISRRPKSDEIEYVDYTQE